ARDGLTPGQVGREAAIVLGSTELGELWNGGVAIGVSGWSLLSERRNLTDLENLLIDTPGGGHIPLGRVANLIVYSTPSDITRVGGSNKIDVNADVSGSGNVGSATAAVQAQLAQL